MFELPPFDFPKPAIILPAPKRALLPGLIAPPFRRVGVANVLGINDASNTTGATLAISTPVGVLGGSTVFVAVTERSSSGNGSVADSAGNTYTALFGLGENNVNTNGRLMLFVATNITQIASGGSITYTKSGSSNGAAMSVFRVAGLGTNDAGATATAFGSTGSKTVTSGTPAQAGEFFVAAVAAAGTAAPTQASGWTSPPNFVDNGAGSPARVFGGTLTAAGSAAQTYAPTWTPTTNAWCAGIVAYRIA